MFDVQECTEFKILNYDWFYFYIFKAIFLHAQLEMPHKYAFLKYLWLLNARLVVSLEIMDVIIWCSEVPNIWPSQVCVLWLTFVCLSSFMLKNLSHKFLTFVQCGHPGTNFVALDGRITVLIRKNEEESGHGLNYVAVTECSMWVKPQRGQDISLPRLEYMTFKIWSRSSEVWTAALDREAFSDALWNWGYWEWSGDEIMVNRME